MVTKMTEGDIFEEMKENHKNEMSNLKAQMTNECQMMQWQKCFPSSSSNINSLNYFASRVLSQKKLYTFCHSGLDPESSIFDLDSHWSLSRT